MRGITVNRTEACREESRASSAEGPEARFSPRAGTTAVALMRVLTDSRWAAERSSHLPGVATDVPPGLCESHNPRWSRLPDGRLPLRQGCTISGRPQAHYWCHALRRIMCWGLCERAISLLGGFWVMIRSA
jgi:hypothetical protein